MSARCVRCDYETDDTDGLTACPYCGDDGIPMDPARDTTVRVNWHELRILVMWAMNFAGTTGKSNSEAAVAAIARRLAHQKPDPSWPGLTMGDDIRELAEAFPSTKVVGGTDPRGKGEHVVWPGSWTLRADTTGEAGRG